jgi:hypothetical protein
LSFNIPFSSNLTPSFFNKTSFSDTFGPCSTAEAFALGVAVVAVFFEVGFVHSPEKPPI